VNISCGKKKDEKNKCCDVPSLVVVVREGGKNIPLKHDREGRGQRGAGAPANMGAMQGRH